MKSAYLKKNGSKSIILFFAGWGMDRNPFDELASMECDSVLVYDYSDFHLELSIAEYANVYVFAWSFGVYAAARWLGDTQLLPALAVAINGTVSPIDDQHGIPSAVFEATLNSLSEPSLLKFFRRMCGSPSMLEQFLSTRPKRDIESLRNELVSMKTESASSSPLFMNWDKAYISSGDRIFPAQNQLRFWEKHARAVIETDGAHLPDSIASIIRANLVNKALVKQRFEKSLSTYESHAHCQREIALKLFEKWVKADFRKGKRIYEIGCGTGLFTRIYAAKFQPSQLELNDIANIPAIYFKGLPCPYDFRQGDAEHCVPTMHPDYIVSASTVQWFENIPLFLSGTCRHLAPKGVIVFSTFGESNLKELQQKLHVSLNYPSLDMWQSLLHKNGMEIIELEEEEISYSFPSPIELIKSLKYTGVNGIRPYRSMTRLQLAELAECLPHANGSYPLTYNPVYIIARKL